MKKATKRLIAAALAALVTTSVCTTFTGCNKDGAEDSTGPIMTLPTGTTGTGETTSTNGGTTETTSTNQGGTIVQPTKGFNVLTGEPAVNDLSYKRPVAIVVDNNTLSYANQTGLGDADILYETLVAPGITRFLMVTSDYTQIDSVCNIRSGRDYHLDLAAFHNAVLVCHGGSITDNYDFYSLAKERYGSRWGYVDTMFEKWFAVDVYGEVYGTIANHGDRVDLKYDTIFKSSAMTALLESDSKFVKEGQGSLVGYAKESLKFVDYGTTKDMSGASTATNIDLRFKCQGSSNVKSVSYKYDSATGKYLRNQDGVAHTDSVTGEQLAFTNVITLFTNVKAVSTGIANDPTMTLVDTKGSGVGYYFNGGKVINIKWTSNGADLILTDPNGDELELATGNTYIGYLDISYLSGGTSFWN
ncbi:MAG: DUF3048 domain-containing protein [Clostridia bacterium]|nr:DUF3048 domain-containing protein [Clostridia bacterium]